MVAIIIYSVILIACLWVLAMQDAISHWIDEADFEEESTDEKSTGELDNSEYDWGHNVKGYRYEDEQDL